MDSTSDANVATDSIVAIVGLCAQRCCWVLLLLRLLMLLLSADASSRVSWLLGCRCRSLRFQ